MSLLTASNLSCQRQQNLIFKNLHFSLSSGELLLITGQNGSGKSSLLRLMTSLTRPISGDIQLNNQSIFSRPDYQNQLHYIGHQSGIKLGLSCQENLKLAFFLMQENTSQTENKIQHALSLYQLDNKACTLAGNLSAGQKRKLALARLSLSEKILWILDEPLTALDRYTQQIFLEQLRRHLSTGGIAVLSSHQIFKLEDYKVKSLVLESAC